MSDAAGRGRRKEWAAGLVAGADQGDDVIPHELKSEAVREQQAHASARSPSFCSCCELYEPVILLHPSRAATPERLREGGERSARLEAG